MGRHRNSDHRNVRIVDQCLPTTEPPRDICSLREPICPLHVASCQRDNLAAGIIAECRDEDGSAVIAPDDANANHDRFSTDRYSRPFRHFFIPVPATPLSAIIRVINDVTRRGARGRNVSAVGLNTMLQAVFESK
jgi:hypothetical protein